MAKTYSEHARHGVISNLMGGVAWGAGGKMAKNQIISRSCVISLHFSEFFLEFFKSHDNASRI